MQIFDMQGDRALRRYARALEQSGDYRLLRRLPRLNELWMMPTPATGTDITIGVIDTETTGIGDNDQLIEIAVAKLRLVDGQVADVTEPVSLLEDPGVPLSPAITRITGLTDDDVRGKRFDEQQLAIELADVDALLAFNAPFDSRFLQRRFSGLRHPWICARADFDWAAAGRSGRSQQALLTECGHFYDAHRAAPDVWALLVLIAHAAPDGRTIAAHMIDRGRALETRISATGAPYAVKEALKGRGYRWQAGTKVWRIDVPNVDAGAEISALSTLHPSIRPVIEDVDWFNRHCG